MYLFHTFCPKNDPRHLEFVRSALAALARQACTPARPSSPSCSQQTQCSQQTRCTTSRRPRSPQHVKLSPTKLNEETSAHGQIAQWPSRLSPEALPRDVMTPPPSTRARRQPGMPGQSGRHRGRRAARRRPRRRSS